MSKGSANEPSISDSDDDSVSELFDGVDNLTLVDQADDVHRNGDDASTFTSCTTRSQQRKLKGQHRKGRTKQHSLEHLRQRVSHLMSIFEENGWFIPLPESSTSSSEGNKNKKGKVWSNRNYGADKKRQRKQTERQSIEGRIAQLENVLRDEHDMELEGGIE